MKRLTRTIVATLIGLTVPVAALQAADAGKPVTMTPEQMTWVPNPANPAVSMAVTSGDPNTGPFRAFHKFAAGFTAPLHTHTANTQIVVIKGTMAMVGADGKATKFPPGSFYTQPNTYPHVTKCLGPSECLVYMVADAKWDLKPVEAKK
jgi:hypothetical protein